MRKLPFILVVGIAGTAAYLLFHRSSAPTRPAEGQNPIAREPAAASHVKRATPALLAPEQKTRNDRPRMPRLRNQDDGDGETEWQNRRRERRARARARFDENNDGQLDEGERAALRQARFERRRARTLEAFDDDGDGELNDDERTMRDMAIEERTAERAAQMVASADADNDGSLSRSEAETGGRRMQRLLRNFEEVDSDGDGLISLDELQRAILERRQRRRATFDAQTSSETSPE
jgi:Ca2+-binding EF-hand superfamily protein